MSQLDNINSWKNNLGLLPINLFSTGQNNKYILLNGGYGDFCIDINADKSTEEYYSFAWSSNTKTFVALKDDKIYLFNWLKEKEEKAASPETKTPQKKKASPEPVISRR